MALLSVLTSMLAVLTPPAKPPLKPPDPVVSTPTPGGTARGSVGALPVSSQALPESPTGLASWYPMRPVTCDGQPMPWWVKAWTAHLSLPCGSMVTVSGPAGSITVPVWDRGPEAWTGRVLDLNPAAFEAVAGNLWTGVVSVAWRPAA